MRRDITALLAVLLSSTAAHAEITVPGADGSDGVFNPTANVTIDLSQATTLQWDQASPVAGKGVYDPNKWAVIFKYSSVNVPTGVTVTFKNHPSRAPVVWLVSGDVTIAGSVRLDGQGNAGEFLSEPGPGGFRGGRANGQANIAPPSGGFGPGGSPYLAGWASHRTAGYVENGKSGAVYGHALSLMGGSGGAGYHDRSGSALGGGAGGGCDTDRGDELHHRRWACFRSGRYKAAHERRIRGGERRDYQVGGKHDPRTGERNGCWVSAEPWGPSWVRVCSP